MAGQTVVGSSRPGIMVNAAGRVVCHRMTVKAGGGARIGQGLGQQGITVRASTLGAASIGIHMAETAVALVDDDGDIHRLAAGVMTAGADPGPSEITVVMAAVKIGSIGMAVKACHTSGIHDHVRDRSIGAAQVGSPGRIVTDHATAVMQGQDTVGSGPSVGEQRIPGAGPTTAMTDITGIDT